MTTLELPQGYFPLPAGYAYAPLRVGLTLRNPEGREVYFQLGDDESIIRETFAAIDECDNPKIAAHCAIVALSDYFD
jgi:hypothetical protein